MILKTKGILRRLADIFNEHWIWKTIILFMPSIYMPVIVKYAGERFGLSDTNGEMTILGIIITIVLYTFVLGVNILSNYKAKRDKEKDLEHENELQAYENTMDVYVRLMNVFGNICDVKLGAIYKYINTAHLTGEFHKPFNETVYPEQQLKSIAKEMKTCLSEITAPPVNHISVSMAYEFPSVSDDIHWIDQQEVQQCMQLRELKNNRDTTFYKIYSGQSNFLFFNDKKEAADKGCYVFDNKDDRYHNIGSIICDEISVEDDNGKIARIILTISTYGYRFTDSNDSEVLANMSEMIEEVILQQFEKRIRIELALLYVKKQYNNA